jgi:hypothetical protein
MSAAIIATTLANNAGQLSEALATVELEGRAMDGVRAGLDGALYNCAAGTAELRGRDTCGDAELLGCIDRRKEDEGIDQRLVVVDAVEQEVVRLRPEAIHRQSASPALGVAVGLRVSLRAIGIVA